LYDTHKATHTLAEPLTLPEWVRRGYWTWEDVIRMGKNYHSIVGKITPKFMDEDEETGQRREAKDYSLRLDIVAFKDLDETVDDSIASLKFAALYEWAQGGIHVTRTSYEVLPHQQQANGGPDNVLVAYCPFEKRLDYATLAEAIRRWGLWALNEPTRIYSCSITASLDITLLSMGTGT